ncbi:MAG: metallophosphoesterase [Nanoarchaeota archaeon]
MKILAFADMHDNNAAFERLKEKAKKADILICAGDLTIFENNIEKLLNKLNRLNKQVLMIPGNHEDPNSLKLIVDQFENIINIHKLSFIKDNCLFLGYGDGGFSMIDRNFEKASKNFEKEIKKFRENNKDARIILATHAPPYNTNIDKIGKNPCGVKNIKDFILKVRPDLAIAGHLHENAKKRDKVKNTIIINPGADGEIIDL